jgi:hypothetical protein
MDLRNIVRHPDQIDETNSHLSLGYLQHDIYDEEQFLHQNLVKNSDKQQSSQGSVFYVKLCPEI